MLVSTRAATIVELVARPAAIRRTPRGGCCLAIAVTRGRAIEEQEPRRRIAAARAGPHERHPDAVGAGRPFELIARLDVESLGNGLGHCDLKLAGDLDHRPYYSKD